MTVANRTVRYRGKITLYQDRADGRTICAHMSRPGGTQVLATRQVKRAASTTTATTSAAAAAVAAAAAAAATAANLTVVLDYASAAKRYKLSAAAGIAQPNEIGGDKIIIMTDTATDTQKRANFSALTVGNPNGVTNRISPSLANTKPGSAKKLVIKNFKSKRI